MAGGAADTFRRVTAGESTGSTVADAVIRTMAPVLAPIAEGIASGMSEDAAPPPPPPGGGGGSAPGAALDLIREGATRIIDGTEQLRSAMETSEGSMQTAIG